jgi:hypothetical protein
MTDWRDIETAPKDGTRILASIHPDLSTRINRPDLARWDGLMVVVRHPGIAADGFDIGWSVGAPVGVGLGCDDWFDGWQPLPAPPQPAG